MSGRTSGLPPLYEASQLRAGKGAAAAVRLAEVSAAVAAARVLALARSSRRVGMVRGVRYLAQRFVGA